jgi:hypothetical protein
MLQLSGQRYIDLHLYSPSGKTVKFLSVTEPFDIKIENLSLIDRSKCSMEVYMVCHSPTSPVLKQISHNVTNVQYVSISENTSCTGLIHTY